MAETKTKIKRKRLKGIIVSKSGSKTVVVRVETKKLHPIYGKRHTISKKYHAHDIKDSAAVGDVVTIEEARPISKLKRWRIV
jgi:small subunit ribosomal protein S17